MKEFKFDMPTLPELKFDNDIMSGFRESTKAIADSFNTGKILNDAAHPLSKFNYEELMPKKDTPTAVKDLD